jgi:hypothetical protein
MLTDRSSHVPGPMDVVHGAEIRHRYGYLSAATTLTVLGHNGGGAEEGGPPSIDDALPTITARTLTNVTPRS